MVFSTQSLTIATLGYYIDVTNLTSSIILPITGTIEVQKITGAITMQKITGVVSI